MDKKDKKTLANKLGYAFGVICVACLMSIIVASTIKFLMWIF